MKRALLLLVPLLAPAQPPGESTACRACHREIFDRYAQTPMGRSFYLPRADTVIEEWNREFYHPPSDRHYEILRRGDNFFVRRYQKDQKGLRSNLLELQVTHIMGSGERARSYLHRTKEGRLIELPVSWYSQEKRWAMAPGYDRPNHPDFTRTVNHKCMFCHNAYPNVPPERARQGWDHDVRFPEPLPLGIDCQRCHGHGAVHARTGARDAIVNPVRLHPRRQDEVCMQCHLETTTFRLPESYRRFGRGFYSYRPGEPLGDYIVHFDHAPGAGRDDKFEIVSAAYRLRKSACFLKSKETLSCLTCHNPHQPIAAADRPPHYRARCLGCHTSRDAAPHKVPVAEFERSDCVACHMPLRRTEDVVHVVMTDHLIQRHKPASDLLAARREKTDEEQLYRGEVVLYYPDSAPEVYRAIAQVKEKANLERGVQWLERSLTNTRSPEPYFELAEAQLALGQKEAAVRNYVRALQLDPNLAQVENKLATLLAGMGRVAEAIERYRRAIRIDPGFPDPSANLGLTLLERGDRHGAASAFRQAIAADPMYSPAHRDLGALLLLEGKLEEARAQLELALAIDPSDVKTRHNLDLALRALRKQDPSPVRD